MIDPARTLPLRARIRLALGLILVALVLALAGFALRGLAQYLAREYGPHGIHVVHTIIDGLIWEDQTKQRFAPDEATCIAPQAIVDTYMHLIAQDKSAWTQEIGIRPFSENF